MSGVASEDTSAATTLITPSLRSQRPRMSMAGAVSRARRVLEETQGAFMPSLGNHEYEGDGAEFNDYYARLFGGAGFDTDALEYYRFKSGGVYFFSLSTEADLEAGSPQAEWPHETSSVPADLDEMRAAFAGFHPEVQRQLAIIPAATKWANFDAEPLPVWSRGRVVLLGDACHAMLPYMGQGAAMAIEDGAMLTRCLEASEDDIEYALRLYEANRKDRTAAMQRASRENEWLKSSADPDWVWAYDVFQQDLLPPSEIACAQQITVEAP